MLLPGSGFDFVEHEGFVDVKASNYQEESDSDQEDRIEEDECLADLLDDSDDCEDHIFHFHGPLPTILDSHLSSNPTGETSEEDPEHGEDGHSSSQDHSDNRPGGVDRMELLSNIRDLLSESFDFGCDDMGSINLPQKQACSLFRDPLKFSPHDFSNLIKVSKEQFLDFVTTCVVPHNKKVNLTSLAQTFLLLIKLTQDISFRVVASLFALSDKGIG